MHRYILELENVSQIFGEKTNPTHALRSVSLQVPEKEVVIIMGPSGAGKSTLLAIAGALRRPTAGEVIIDGQRLSVLSDHSLADVRLHKIGFVFQEFNLLESLSVMQNLELVLDGAVDPYFRAQANLIFQIDSEGESNFEVEEAYAETTSLPGNFQVKAGQFQTEFGRLNPTHPHSWSFVDVPLINGRFFGEDGLRNPGARLSWLTPLPFYSELFLAVQNSFGETASSFASDHDGEPWFGRPAVDRSLDSFGELLFTPRWAVSFDPSPTVTVLAGASAAVGPNASGGDTATQVYGVDAYLTWKAANHHGGFPFVAWQTEAMIRRYEAGAYDGSDPAQPDPLPAETLTDYGFYTQLTCGFRKGWVVGLRGDWVSADSGAFEPDPDRDPRWRISPNLTWFPTEYSKLRLQYNLDDREAEGVDHSVWLQMEFTLGAHAAHKF